MFEVSIHNSNHCWKKLSSKPLKNKFGLYNIFECETCKIKAKSHLHNPDIFLISGTYSFNKSFFCFSK